MANAKLAFVVPMALGLIVVLLVLTTLYTTLGRKRRPDASDRGNA